jgi:hypothetical protein
VKWYLRCWAVTLAIIVIVGWASGNVDTGQRVAEYVAFTFVGGFLLFTILWGFVELRRRPSGVPVEDAPTARPQSATLRSILATVAVFAFSTFLAIHEATSGIDWLAFAVAVLGMVLFGGRLLVVLLRMRGRQSSAT